MADKNRPLFKQSSETIEVLSVMVKAKIGETITYKTLAARFRSPISMERLRSAIASARRILLREKQYVFGSVPKEGYVRLDDEGTVHDSARDVKMIGRKSRRTMAKLATVNPENLSPNLQGQLDRTSAVLGVLSGALAIPNRKILNGDRGRGSDVRKQLRDILDNED